MKKKFSIIMSLALVLSLLFTSSIFAETYVVQSGDVLWKIAESYETDWETLAEYNDLENGHLIYAGQELMIPGEEFAMEEMAQEAVTLTLLHTNDMHGFFVEGKYDGMGVSKMATYFKEMKAANPNTLVLDAGDAIQGNNLVTLSDGLNAVPVLNALEYDAIAAGNHEFDYGVDQLLEIESMLDAPVLAANVTDTAGELLVDDYIIKELDGVTVGIFGLGTPETYYKSHPDNTAGITFEDPSAVAQEMVDMLEDQVDVIVALAHLGVEGDATSVMVAEEVQGIDVIIDGHSHTTLDEGMMVGDVLIAQAGEKTKNVGVIDITVEAGEVVAKEASLFTKDEAAELTEDETVAAIIADLQAANALIEEEVVAVAPYTLDGEREDVRTGETNLGNLITASLRNISGADLALTNGGGIRASIETGDITKGEVLTVLPYSNTVRVIELTGADVIAAIENGVSGTPEASGAFPHISGMTVQYDSSMEAGSKVVSVMIDGMPIDEAATYTLATNDFLVAGGDSYDVFTGKNVVAEFGAMDEVLIDYLNAVGFDASEVIGRIVDVADMGVEVEAEAVETVEVGR